MSRITVSGISLSDFIARTKNALEATLGSPIKKERIVRQFLTRQLHGSNKEGQNEHNLAQFFAESTGSEQSTAHPSMCRVVTLTEYEPELASDSLVIENVQHYLCMTDEAVDRTLEDLFRSSFPDHDGVTDSLMDARLIEDYLEKHDEDETLAEELANMPSHEILEWLIETFPIGRLTSDSGLRDILWMNRIEIDVVAEELRY